MTTESLPPIPRAVLITGAAHRIGHAIACDLAKNDFAVAIHYNSSRDKAEAAVAEITAKGGRAAALHADLLQEDDVSTLVKRAAEAVGPIGVLVNNASSFDVDAADSVTKESWDLNMETNLRAPFLLCQSFARELPDGSEGAIVNLIDQRVLNLTPYFTSYTVSKMGLWTLTRTLALAYAPRIRVNAIGPGPVLPSKRQTQEQFDRQWQAMPLRRGATVQEICDGVRFLIGARSMTGQMIALDGGQHLGWAQESRGVVAEE